MIFINHYKVYWDQVSNTDTDLMRQHTAQFLVRKNLLLCKRDAEWAYRPLHKIWRDLSVECE